MWQFLILSSCVFSVHSQTVQRFSTVDFTSVSTLDTSRVNQISNGRFNAAINSASTNFKTVFTPEISVKVPDKYKCSAGTPIYTCSSYNHCDTKCMLRCEKLFSIFSTRSSSRNICPTCIEKCCPQLDIVVENDYEMEDISFIAGSSTIEHKQLRAQPIKDIFKLKSDLTLEKSDRRKYYFQLDYNAWNKYLKEQQNSYSISGDPCDDSTDGGLYYRTVDLMYKIADSFGTKIQKTYYFTVPIEYTPVATSDACCTPYEPTEIDAVGISFSPSSVTITEGNAVTWKSLPMGHNARHTDGFGSCVEETPSLFSSHYVGDWQWTKSGYEFLHTFTGAGSYPFMCSPHCATGGMTGSVTVNPASCSLNYGWQYYKEGQCVFVGHCSSVSTPYKYATEEACLESCCDPVNDCPADVWPQNDDDCPAGFDAQVPEGKCCKECVDGGDPCDGISCDSDPVPAGGCPSGQHSETYNDGCCSKCVDDVVIIGENCTVSSTIYVHGDTWHEGCRECECVDGVAYCCNVYPELHDVSTAQKTKIAQAFVDANGGSASNTGGSYTDIVNLVQAHLTAFTPAHGHAWFLPWHRAYIAQLNKILQDNSDTCVNIPYWDWTLDEGERPIDGNIPAFDTTIMGTTRNLGTLPADSRLKDGMFACDSTDSSSYWVPHVSGGSSLDAATTNCLQRRYNDNTVVTFDTASEVDDEINDNNDFTSFYLDVEGGSHIPPHTYVKGHMTTGASSFDPLFFMHHNMVDKIWDDWQKKSGGLHQYDYDEELVPFYQPLDGIMDIVGATPADTLNIERMCFLNETDASGTTICICARHAASGETPPVGTLASSKPKLKAPHYTDWTSSLTAANRAKIPAASIFRPRASDHVVTHFGLNREHLRRREREKANKYVWSAETDGLFRNLSDWNARGGYQSAEKQIDLDDELFELDTVPNGAPDDKKESRVWSTLAWKDSSQSDYDYNDIVLHVNHAVTETGTNLIITVVQNGADSNKLELYLNNTGLEDSAFSRGLHNNGAFLPWHRGYIINSGIVSIKDTLAPVIRIGLKEVVLFSELQFKINGKSPTKYAGERRLLNIKGTEYPALPPRKLEEGVASEIKALRERLLEKQGKRKEESHVKPGHCDLDNTIDFIRKFPKEVTKELMKSC